MMDGLRKECVVLPVHITHELVNRHFHCIT